MADLFARHGFKIVCVFAFVAATCALNGLALPLDEDARSWLPAHGEAADALAWYEEHFDDESSVLVSWEGSRWDDPRLERMARRLELRPTLIGRCWTPERFVRQFTLRRGRQLRVDGSEDEGSGFGVGPSGSGTAVLNSEPRALNASTLTSQQPSEAIREEALARIEGVLVGRGGSPAVLAVQLTDAGWASAGAAVGLLQREAAAVGVPEAALHVAGLPVVAAEAHRAARQTLAWHVPVSLIAVGFWTLCALESVRRSLMVVAVALAAGLAGLAAARAAGDGWNAALVVLPSLSMVVTATAGVYLLHPWRNAAREDGAGWPARAARSAWGVCLGAGATSVAGVVALAATSVPPMGQLALHASIAVIVGVAGVMLVVPSMLMLSGGARRSNHRASVIARHRWMIALAGVLACGAVVVLADETRAAREPLGMNLVSVTLAMAGVAVAALVDAWCNRRMQVAARLRIEEAPSGERSAWRNRPRTRFSLVSALLVVLLLGACTWGVPQSETRAGVADQARRDSRVAADYAWLDRHVGVIPLETVLRFTDECALPLDERLQLVAALEARLAAHPRIRGTISAASFIPGARLERNDDEGRGVARGSRGRELPRSYFGRSGPDELWRITAHAGALSGSDVEGLIGELRAIVAEGIGLQPGVYANRPAAVHGSADFTGPAAALLAGRQAALAKMIEAPAIALGVAAAVTIAVVHSALGGILALLPTVLAMAGVLGGLGWAGVRIDLGMGAASVVALGLAVQGALHALVLYRRGLEAGVPRVEAARRTRALATPLLVQTGMIAAAGLGVLGLSDLPFAAHFGWVAAAAVAATVLANLVVLPALLSGPLGAALARSLRIERTSAAAGGRAQQSAHRSPAAPHLSEHALSKSDLFAPTDGTRRSPLDS